MDRFFSVIHENWTVIDHPTVLPAYALWRLNWIHPFVAEAGFVAGLNVRDKSRTYLRGENGLS
jgi:hypothetical protein